MKTLSTKAMMSALAVAMLLLTSAQASAQSKAIQGNSVTMTVTVEALDQATRSMTVKDEKGIYETIQAPPEMKRFNELKVGDRITVRYYENVVIRLKKPGEAPVDVLSGALTRGQGASPAGTLAEQRTITVTITAMDPKTQSATVKGPNGYVYSRRVADKKTFDSLKVGDQLDMTWTNAMLISAESPK